jgi:hypothetical protein
MDDQAVEDVKSGVGCDLVDDADAPPAAVVDGNAILKSEVGDRRAEVDARGSLG